MPTDKHVRVPVFELLDERLDTGFYSRQYFDGRTKLSATGFDSPPVGKVCEPWQFGAYALCNHIEWSNEDKGIPYVKAEALGSPLVNRPGLTYITPQTHELLKKSQLGPGDIVVSTSGTIGLCAVWPRSLGRGNSNQDTIKFNPKSDEYDNYFLAGWVACRYGQTFLTREAGGGVQQHVYLYNFKRIPLPKPDIRAQRYIGEKIRQAERMTDAGRRIQRRIATLLAPFHPDSVPNGRTSRVDSAQLMDTLNANPYMSRFVHSQEIVDRHASNSIDRFSSSVADGPFGSNLTVADYRVGPDAIHPVVRVKNCENGCFDREDLVWIDATKQSELIRSEVLAGDLLVTKAGRIGSAAVYPDDLPAGNITSHLIRARIKPPIDAHYVAEFLETPVGRAVTLRHSFKSTRPELTKAEIEVCPIPLLPEDDMAAVAKLARAKNRFSEYSVLLLTAARLLVEGLIEGRCSEVELADAQRALQEGNLDPDRKLLSRLSKGGLDMPSEARLFLNVDGLYKALGDLRDTAGDQEGK
jgi:type I restriction enzyme S subunit